MSSRTRRLLVEAITVLAAITIVTLVMTYPVGRESMVALPSDAGDPLLNAWLLAWDAERARHAFRGLWDLPAFFPHCNTLLYTEHLLGIALVVAPVEWLTRNPILAYNAAFLLSFVVAAAGMYALARSLTESRQAAWIAALIYAFVPYRLSMASHVQVLWSGWLPLGLWALHRYFKSGSRRAVLASAGAFLLQGLSNGYYLYFSVIPFVIIGVHEAARSRVKLFPLLRDAALAIAVTIVVLAPVILAYAHARRTQGLVRSYEEINSYGADVSSYLHTSNDVRAWHWLPGLAKPEGDLFPGLLVIVLAIASVRADGRSDRRPYVVVGAIAFLLSLGPELTIWGHRLASHGPYEWLMYAVPGFDGLRVPARFVVLVYLSLAVLASFGVRRLLAGHSAAVRRMIVAALTAGVLVDGYAVPVAMAPIPPPSPDDAAAYRWLRDSPAGGVLELPIQRPLSNSAIVYPTRATAGYLNTVYQLRTLLHHHPIVNGQSGYEPLLNVQLRRLVEEPRLDEALAMMRAVGVRYIVVHPPATSSQPIRAVTATDVAGQSAQIAGRLDFGSTAIFQLRPWPTEAVNFSLDHMARIPANEFRASASAAADRLANAFDGNQNTRWSTARAQSGQEWIDITFERPRRVGAIEMDLGSDFSDYPRHLTVLGSDAGVVDVTLFDGATIPIVAATLVQRPTLPAVVPLVIPVPTTSVSRLVIRQTGQSRLWRWSIHELTVWEQR